ncbi:hypothetical protein A9Q96_08370 [Rhodobacterales bacterium 52_120_T64]|nr:hypothetical protein A9Q96_08370 [Rhodobacterales bacterium 52_120_T64]
MTEARDLVLALKGHWMGNSGVACCPAHGDKHPSLSIGTGGNGQLLLNCHAGCAFSDVLAALRSLGLLGGKSDFHRSEQIGKAAQRVAERANTFRREKQARELWESASSTEGTIAEAYILARGITCALPYSIRYIGNCWHPTAKRLPALVSYIRGADGFAVHRTYIRTDGSGKADVTPAKAMLGPAMGGAVRVSDGPGRLVVAEGIETALSLMSGIIEGPHSVWAALSAGGMKGLNLPDCPGELLVAPDGDAVGIAAANSLAERADGLGWKVSLLIPPQGSDWNDVLVGKAVAA